MVIDYNKILENIKNGVYDIHCEDPGYPPIKPVIDKTSRYFDRVMQEYEDNITDYGNLKEAFEKAHKEAITKFSEDVISMMGTVGANRKQAEKSLDLATELSNDIGIGLEGVLSIVSSIAEIIYLK